MTVKRLVIGAFVLVCVGMLVNPSHGRIDPGTVAGVWLFDENGGNIARDSSGNGNDGEIFGATWAKGKFNSALEFDGVEDYVDTTENVGSGSVFTVCFWVNPGGTTGTGRNPIVNRWKNDTSDRGFQIRVENDNTNGNIFISSDGITYSTSPLPGFFALDEWEHVAMVFDAGKITVYKDGENVLDDNVDQKESNNGKTPLAMGRAMNGGVWDYFKGLIDEVAVFEAALTQDDIRNIMNQGLESVTSVSSIGRLTTTWGTLKSN